MSSMLKLEVDGKPVEVPHGSMVMEAATRLGIYVPHFCYHKKLSIAANCRMCLVEVEKAPKPMPACATPVTDGMKVWTHSDKAKQAQNGVMEFLLINHPLDCPICDQGGECQLQDLAVGYGGSGSRYSEAKRVVFHKNLGPLVSAEEMSRCIHCTRCIRFGQEVAGVMELGMAGRGEHSEIMSFVGKSVDSELSGNMIDICPVGALTSKPFRYNARTWELSRRRTVSPHDSVGANLIAQVKQGKVMRVVPFENEEVNECWISDRDRFSYEALGSEQRLTRPMIRRDQQWQETDWQSALDFVVERLQGLRQPQDAPIAALAAPGSTLEEMYLLQQVVRGLGSESVDFRLRQSDFAADPTRAGAPWLGMPISALGELDRVLLVGSFLRKDHPLLANRFRQAAKRGQRLHLLHSHGDDALISGSHSSVVLPSQWRAMLAAVVKAVAVLRGKAVPPMLVDVVVSAGAQAIADSLCAGEQVGLFLGNAAQQHPEYSQLIVLIEQLASLLGARYGHLGDGGNAVGGYLAGCVPGKTGANAHQMLATPAKAYVLLHAEPTLDCADPQLAAQALNAAEFVVALTAFQPAADMRADVLLPVTPFTETSGSFVNTEGRLQSFNAVVPALGDSRPAWKVLRVLANLLQLPGFAFNSSEEVRDEVLRAGALESRLSNASALDLVRVQTAAASAPSAQFERVSDVPIYFSDALVRHAESLQQTRDARAPGIAMHPADAERLGLRAGASVRVAAVGAGACELQLGLDHLLAPGAVKVSAAHASTAVLGSMNGSLTVERL